VGKSSLLNALAGDSAALVGAEQGTTRDYVTQRCKINTLECLLIDTAGTTQATGHDDRVAQQAQQVAREQAAQATLELFCLDGTRAPNRWEQQQLQLHDLSARIHVITKADLTPCETSRVVGIQTSSVTGEGLEQLRQSIYQRLTRPAQYATAVVPDTLLRCRESLRLAGESIERARELTQQRQGEELVSAELRVALDELATVVGAVYTDDLLDRIFSRFCIGK
jgi:tRNA modification GTPase